MIRNERNMTAGSGARRRRCHRAHGRLRIGDPVEHRIPVDPADEHVTVATGAIVEVTPQPPAFAQVAGESIGRRYLAPRASGGERVAVLEGLSEDDCFLAQVSDGSFAIEAAAPGVPLNQSDAMESPRGEALRALDSTVLNMVVVPSLYVLAAGRREAKPADLPA